jgi:hypothetical protein
MTVVLLQTDAALASISCSSDVATLVKTGLFGSDDGNGSAIHNVLGTVLISYNVFCCCYIEGFTKLKALALDCAAVLQMASGIPARLHLLQRTLEVEHQSWSAESVGGGLDGVVTIDDREQMVLSAASAELPLTEDELLCLPARINVLLESLDGYAKRHPSASPISSTFQRARELLSRIRNTYCVSGTRSNIGPCDAVVFDKCLLNCVGAIIGRALSAAHHATSFRYRNNVIQHVRPIAGESEKARLFRGKFCVEDSVGFVHTVPCVVKVAKRSISSAENAADWSVLQQEAQILDSLSKTQTSLDETAPCVQCYFVDKHLKCLVLEDHGASVHTLLVWGSARWCVASLLLGIVSAVEWVHKHDVLHGNIRSESFLYKATSWCDGTVKLGNFERARARGQPSMKSEDHKFSALEAHTAADTTLGMDMFSLGLVVWQLLHNTARPALETAAALNLTEQAALNERLQWPDRWGFMKDVVVIGSLSRLKAPDLMPRLCGALADPCFAVDFDACRKRVTEEQRSALAMAPPRTKPPAESVAAEESISTPSAPSPSPSDSGLSQQFVPSDGAGPAAPVLDHKGTEDPQKDTGPSSPSATTIGPVEARVNATIAALRVMQREMVFDYRSPYLEMIFDRRVVRHIADWKTEEDSERFLRRLVMDIHMLSCDERVGPNLSYRLYEIVGLLHGGGKPSEGALEKSKMRVSAALQRLEEEVVRLCKDARCLRELRAHIATSIAEFPALRESIMYLTSRSIQRNCPALPVLLPWVSHEWPAQPGLLQNSSFRLFFLCSYSKLPLPCGPSGAGHYMTADAVSIHKLAPVVRISLLTLISALKRQECGALPTVFFGAKLDTKELQLQYLNAMLSLLDEVSGSVASNSLDVEEVRNRADEAYAELQVLLDPHNPQWDKYSEWRDRYVEWGLRRVGDLWIADSDSAEKEAYEYGKSDLQCLSSRTVELHLTRAQIVGFTPKGKDRFAGLSARLGWAC